MEKIKEKIEILKQNNKFFKFILNGKNIAIIILSFLLFCAFCAYTNPVDITQYGNEIKDLNSQLTILTTKLDDNKKQITNLQDANKLLQQEKSALQEEKQTLENEKNELTTKVEELKKNASSSSTTTSSQSQVSSASASSAKSSSKPSVTSSANNTQSYTVYITNTGSKYHTTSCSYLKKSKIAITLSEAKAKGYTACSKCNP